jgi:hypothetical protein
LLYNEFAVTILQDLSVDGSIRVKGIFKKWDEDAWTGLIWLRKRKGGRLL